jgi:DNA-binding response OmpR family regulator
VLRVLRAEEPAMRILIVTARGDEADKVRGLKLGADDYVTKPFGLLELLARVESLLRRSQAAKLESGAASGWSEDPSTRFRSGGSLDPPTRPLQDTPARPRHVSAPEPPMRFGDVEVHPASRQVFRRGVVVPLRPKEFDLLVELVRRRGTVLSRVELMEVVWGYSSAVISRTVDTHIGELRRKLEADPSRPRHITTVRSAGYRLDD